MRIPPPSYLRPRAAVPRNSGQGIDVGPELEVNRKFTRGQNGEAASTERAETAEVVLRCICVHS